jgi:hypothetical protein
MADDRGKWLTTCPLCLEPQERSELLGTPIKGKHLDPAQTVRICKSCAEIITDSLYNEKSGADQEPGRVASIDEVIEAAVQAEIRGELLNEVAPAENPPDGNPSKDENGKP